MDYGHTGDIEESALAAQAGAKMAVNDHMPTQETLYAPPLYDSSMPLLGTVMPNGDGGEQSQQRATSSSEEEPPPPPNALRNGLILLAILLLPFFIIIGSMVALMVSEIDPLGFSFLAFLLLFSLVLSALTTLFLAGMIRGATMKLYSIMGIPTDKLDPKRDVSGHMVFSFGCLIIYLMFYGMVLFWASSRAVADLIDEHGVWHDFQAKVNVPDALAMLTRCLQDSIPSRYATVEDFSICLKDIGVKGG